MGYDNLLVCGDLNFRKILWETPELTTGANELRFMEMLLGDYFLMQVNTIPTRRKHMLNLVITSTPERIEEVTVLTPKQSGIQTDHGTIVFQYKTSIKAAPRLVRGVFDYRRGDFEGLRSALEAINLSGVLNLNTCVNTNWM